MERRELPTHLHVEDKLIAGLTIRQVLFLCVGVSVGYSLWLHLAGVATATAIWLVHTSSLARLAPLAQVARLIVSALPVLLMVICVLVRPADRPLEDWLLVALRYLSLPKAAVWRSSMRAAMFHEDSVDARGAVMASEDEHDVSADDEAWTSWNDAHDGVAPDKETAAENELKTANSTGNGQRRAWQMQGGRS